MTASNEERAQAAAEGKRADASHALQAHPEASVPPDSGEPGGGQGRIDVTGIVPETIRIDPSITEGHPGYDESGDSEIIPTSRSNPDNEDDVALKPTTVVGIFDDLQSATDAVEELRQRGFPDEQIGLAGRTPEAETPGAAAHESSGAGIGVLTGASLGGMLAGSAAAPMLTPVLILTPVLTGAVIGGLIGFFIGLGVPEEEARSYQGELEEGRTVVTVAAPGRYDEALAVLRRHGAAEATPANRSVEGLP